MNKNIFDDLFAYDFCKITKIDNPNIQPSNNSNICSFGTEKYLCELDEHVNTRILLGIFKKVNFIANVILAGLICGGVAIVISLLK